MNVLLDTSVLVNEQQPVIDEPYAVSVVSIGELHAGVLLASSTAERADRLTRLSGLLEQVEIVPIDGATAAAYGEIRALTGRRPANDLWIAATAVVLDVELVTADERLARIPGVRARLVS